MFPPKPPHAPHGKKFGISRFSDAVYINSDDISFYKTEGGLLGAKIKDYDSRVNIFRIFPLTHSDRYLSVRDKDLTELGIIEDLTGFDSQQKTLIDEELERRYFVPNITKVVDVKENFGNFFWHVMTDAGERRFSIRDMANNLIRLPDNKIMLVDVDGSRYMLENPAQNAGKALRFIDIWI